MWNNDRYVVWRLIVDAFETDLEHVLKLLPRLITDHILLNRFSKMMVRLTAQVLSSVAKVLRTFSSEEASATAEFCGNIDKFLIASM